MSTHVAVAATELAAGGRQMKKRRRRRTNIHFLLVSRGKNGEIQFYVAIVMRRGEGALAMIEVTSKQTPLQLEPGRPLHLARSIGSMGKVNAAVAQNERGSLTRSLSSYVNIVLLMVFSYCLNGRVF